jgi:predicted alpha-1,2-mannosidase
MSIAYLASFLGLGLAWWSWRKQRREDDRDERAPPGDLALSGVFWTWIVPALLFGIAAGGDLAAVPPLLPPRRRPVRRGAALLPLLLAAGLAAASLVDDVDPRIGTGGHGHTFPGPTLPFGMVQLSPDTRLSGWDGCSGYHDTDRIVYGFSHTHLSGTGVSDYGDILLMPVTGEPQLENGHPDRPDLGYGARFDKASERAEAGYYAVTISDHDIAVELTATPRTGLHRYVFPPGQPAHVVVDLRHRDRLLGSALDVEGDQVLAGYRRSSAWARDQLVHFRAAFSRSFTVTHRSQTQAVLSFGDQGGELMVQVAISAVDQDGARRNLEAEWADFDFPATRRAAHRSWAAVLDRFRIEGVTAAQRTVFATALYHSFLAPNLFSDVDGRYRGHDLAVHRATDRDHYTVFSLWDTYRATHPLFTLVERERTREFIRTFLAIHEQGGRLPVWELAANETDCMIGYHAVSVIADAWLKGIRGYDGQAGPRRRGRQRHPRSFRARRLPAATASSPPTRSPSR